jgi:hypothetical protein
MAITFTLGTTAGTNIVSQTDLDSSKSLTLEVKTLSDTINASTDVSLYTYFWYFIDKPTGTSASIDNSAHANDYQVTLNSIDTWGTYRFFVIAKQTANPSTHKSELNPLKAPEAHFINITVKSTNNELEKPANFQRNWKDQYDKLVNIVDSTTKSINNVKVSNSTTFVLPTTDGTSGQIIKTDGSGNLTFASVDLANLESNITLNSLSDVTVPSPSDGQVLTWDNASSSWISSSASGGIVGLSSNGFTDITLSSGFSMMPADVNSDIGSLLYPFENIYANNVNVGAEYALPSSDGTLNQFLTTDGEGTLSWATISSSGSSDKIEEGNSSIEVIDTGSNGNLIFNTENTNRWKINESGNLLPEAEATYDIGHYASYGSSDNRQVDNIYTKKIYFNNNSLTITGMSSNDFDITIAQSSMNTFKLPFYLDPASASSANYGHILTKDFDDEYSSWDVWGAKFPSTSSADSGDILSINSSKDELTWEKKTANWSAINSDVWTTAVSHNSTYDEGNGKSPFVFAFKNITGKTITIKKISICCLEMHSTTIKWSANKSTDAEFKSNQANSLTSVQTITKTNEDSSTLIGLGESAVTLSQAINDSSWLTILINDISSAASDNKRFVAEVFYEII